MEARPSWNPEHVRARLREAGFDPETLPPVSWFGDGPELADALGELVRAGTKTATAGLLWEYETEGTPVPRPGDREVIVSWVGEPLAVIEVAEVRVLPFDAVDAAFAHDEGEGERTLESWQAGHWRFFSRLCRELGRNPEPTMPIVCVRFRVLVSMPDPAPAARAHFILYVKDQARSTAFYARALGAQPSLDVPGMTEFLLAFATVLGLMPEAGIRKLLGPALPSGTAEDPASRAEVYLVVPDAAAAHARAMEAGARELSPVLLRDWGHRAGYVLDPDGHVLAFAEIASD